MEFTAQSERLNQIATLWTLVRRAHDGADPTASTAQSELIARYGGAIRRYLLGAVRDADLADELFQEFSLRFVKGDLRKADPERGRFRDYVKGVLAHLIADHHNRRQRTGANTLTAAAEPFVDSPPDAEIEKELLENWRDELLARAWANLAEVERSTGQPFYSVLRFRADHPESRSPDLAAQLAEQLNRPLSATSVRQLLHRARERFSELLLDDVAQSIGTPTPEAIEDELRELGLLEYCQPALERRA